MRSGLSSVCTKKERFELERVHINAAYLSPAVSYCPSSSISHFLCQFVNRQSTSFHPLANRYEVKDNTCIIEDMWARQPIVFLNCCWCCTEETSTPSSPMHELTNTHDKLWVHPVLMALALLGFDLEIFQTIMENFIIKLNHSNWCIFLFIYYTSNKWHGHLYCLLFCHCVI